MTLGWGGVAWAQPGGHDTAGPRARASGAHARAWLLRDWVAVPLGYVAIRARHGWGKRQNTAQEAARCAVAGAGGAVTWCAGHSA